MTGAGAMARLSPRSLAAMAIVVIAAGGQEAAFAKVYVCVDPVTKARTVTQFECKETQAPTPAELAAGAEAVRDASIARDARLAAERADRQLLNRFPDEATHRKAHVAELEGVIVHVRRAAARFAELSVQRKPLDEQSEFYRNKPLPPALKRAVDANDASFAALKTVFQQLQVEVAEIDTRYAKERDWLRKLWAGAPPGSMALLPPAPAPSRPR